MAEIQARMSSLEFSRWQAYARLEPFGPLRDDYRAAQVVTMLGNINRDRKQHPEPFTPGDFFASLAPDPEPDPDPVQQSEVLLEKMRVLFAPFLQTPDAA